MMGKRMEKVHVNRSKTGPVSSLIVLHVLHEPNANMLFKKSNKIFWQLV